MVWDTEAEVYVLNEVLKEGLQAFYGKEVERFNIQDQSADAARAVRGLKAVDAGGHAPDLENKPSQDSA